MLHISTVPSEHWLGRSHAVVSQSKWSNHKRSQNHHQPAIRGC
uniref:Uncharacterized protein n=1 Tax=Anguilla anguilla TaxID=7936 RepID=A0A0E9RDW6_ANGAN